MSLKDERLARKIARVRDDELATARARFGATLSGYAFSEAGLRAFADDMNEAAIQAVWSKPGYPAVARRLAELGAPEAADKGVVAHALRDSFRVASAIAALYLDATPGGLTYSRLLALGALGGNGGHGRTHAVIAYMRFLGYIEPGAAGEDGRERPYRPTARMRSAFRRYFVEHLEAIAPLSAEAGALLRLIEADEGQFDTFMARVGEGMIVIGMVGRDGPAEPDISLFSERRSGLALLWRMLLSTPAGETWPSRDVFPLSIADLARRTGVSRSHVQRMIKDAEAVGMLEVDGAGGVRATSLLHQEVHSFLAMLVICFTGCARNLLEDRLRAAETG